MTTKLAYLWSLTRQAVDFAVVWPAHDYLLFPPAVQKNTGSSHCPVQSVTEITGFPGS